MFSTVLRPLANVVGEHHCLNTTSVKSPKGHCSIFFLCFFSDKASTVMPEAIPLIPTQRNYTTYGVVHSHHSDFKEFKLFGSDLLVLSSQHLLLVFTVQGG